MNIQDLAGVRCRKCWMINPFSTMDPIQHCQLYHLDNDYVNIFFCERGPQTSRQIFSIHTWDENEHDRGYAINMSNVAEMLEFEEEIRLDELN